MNYEHILVTVNLTKINQEVIDKALSLAKATGAKVSFIHVDISCVDNASILRKDDRCSDEVLSKSKDELQRQLQALAERADYPISNTLVVSGGLRYKLEETVRKMDVDLLVCGHHHNFWSRIVSSVRELVDTSPIDLLIVHLND
ncbi:universal stress protein [Psychromonas sp.]|uniref:universal stress protein n=1 Tax=Psychromonas sp. TaxID=1884585 RepID=UPI0039E2520A